MKEAFEKDLQFLCKAMAIHEYTPRSPALMELLENYIGNYAYMQSEVLRTIYHLGSPVKKWHLTSSKGDLETLQELIAKQFVKQKKVLGHLPEVMEADIVPEKDSGDLYRLFIKKDLISMSNFYGLIPYWRVCGIGSTRYLESTKESCPTLLPNQVCIDKAVRAGH